MSAACHASVIGCREALQAALATNDNSGNPSNVVVSLLCNTRERAAASAIHFDTLVKTMDAVMSAGFPAVSLLDATPG